MGCTPVLCACFSSGMMGGASDPFRMFEDASDPFLFAGPSLFMAAAQPHSV